MEKCDNCGEPSEWFWPKIATRNVCRDCAKEISSGLEDVARDAPSSVGEPTGKEVNGLPTYKSRRFQKGEWGPAAMTVRAARQERETVVDEWRVFEGFEAHAPRMVAQAQRGALEARYDARPEVQARKRHQKAAS